MKVLDFWIKDIGILGLPCIILFLNIPILGNVVLAINEICDF